MSRKSKRPRGGSRSKRSLSRKEQLFKQFQNYNGHNLEDEDLRGVVERTFDNPNGKIHRKPTVEITPRGENQTNYVEDLQDDEISIVFAVGPAGSGKTMLAVQLAVQGLIDEKYEKIVITRPNVDVDDKGIGFLPGTANEKMAPWMMPIMDVFKETYSPAEIKKMVDNEVIEIVPISFMRGRTFKRSMIIVDESQGTTPNSLLAILTRIGEDSKMVVTGDLDQTDHKGPNGLKDFLEKFDRKENGIHGISVNKFNRGDICRHAIIGSILNLYGKE